MTEYTSHAHSHGSNHHVDLVGSYPCNRGGACRQGTVTHVHRVRELDDPHLNANDPERRVRRLLLTPGYAVLSAENPSGTILSPAENLSRTAALQRDLESMGYAIHPTRGTYVFQEGPSRGRISYERGFLVEHMTQPTAHTFAQKFGQESLIYGGKLLGARGGTMMNFDPVKTVIGPAALRINPYTEVRIGGRSVAFALRE